ncbi:MAG: thermonuclease family protein [Porphyrobacter sp.]|nr:thermonuclease family protein [Porphyrobacter sp.]
MLLLILSAVTVVPNGETFNCTPTHIWDGDGPIWCAEGPRIRLSGIAAREIDGSCRPGHPCSISSGPEARDALVRLLGDRTGVSRHGHILVRGPTMRCRSNGSGGGSRTAAWCVSPRSGDINCAMVAGGWALRWDRYWRGHRCP